MKGAMSIFLISLLFGALVYQLVSIIQPVDNRSEYQIGQRVIIRFEAGAYVIWKAAVIATGVIVFFILAIILNTQGIHPSSGYAYQIADVVTSPRMGAALFGFLVGILLGNLLNRLLRKGSDYKFTSADRLELALIFALTILGVGGEEVLRSSAQRINKISLGTTTEISFADTSPRSSRLSAEQPSGAFRNTQGKSGGSVGLQKLYDIGSEGDSPHIERDKKFIEVLARHEEEPFSAPRATGRLAEGVLSPVASCLSGISSLYGDDAFVDEQLTSMSKSLREIAGDGEIDTSAIRNNLLDVISDVAQYVRPRAKDFEPLDDERKKCEHMLSSTYNALSALASTSILEFRDSKEHLPYVAMSYASVMAALHYYEAAAITMDQWIRKQQARKRSKPITVSERWYLLRAELTVGQFMEEWIRDRGAAASSSLRKYHIDNLKAIVDGMGSFAGISSMSRRNDGYKWNVGVAGAWHSGDEGICDIPDLPKIAQKAPSQPEEDLKPADARERMLTIYDSYLSAQKDFVDHSLKHPTIKVSGASLIESQVITLMQRSLKCIKGKQAATRAEHIERFVRSELNLLENTSSVKAKDEVRKQIRDARQMLALAFQLIDVPVRKAKKDAEEGPIQNRIATYPILEIYETLLATQGQLQSFSEREVVN
jgi:hypothetical protein